MPRAVRRDGGRAHFPFPTSHDLTTQYHLEHESIADILGINTSQGPGLAYLH